MLHPAELLIQRPELRHDMLDAIKTAPPTPEQTYVRHWAAIMGFNAYDRLPQLRMPVLIIHGDQDIGTPIENAHILKSRIPHAELIIAHGAGHGLENAVLKLGHGSHRGVAAEVRGMHRARHGRFDNVYTHWR